MSDASLSRMIEESKARREAGAKAFAEHDKDLCMLCHAYGADKRSLFIDCFYAIYEAVPEALDISGVEPRLERGRGYYLRLCKSCRGRLIGHLRLWREECVALRGVPKNHDGGLDDEDPEKNVPVRIDGAIVMMTEEEWRAWRAARQPDADVPIDASAAIMPSFTATWGPGCEATTITVLDEPPPPIKE